MKKQITALSFCVLSLLFASTATANPAESLTWIKDIQPIVEKQCATCHSGKQPDYPEWRVLSKEDKSIAPRMDTYVHFMNYVTWPATGAVMRRLDDGATQNGKAGNMYVYLGSTDQERAKNLATLKTWLGTGAWNLNRWEERNGVPGVTKEQLQAIKAPY